MSGASGLESVSYTTPADRGRQFPGGAGPVSYQPGGAVPAEASEARWKAYLSDGWEEVRPDEEENGDAEPEPGNESSGSNTQRIQ